MAVDDVAGRGETSGDALGAAVRAHQASVRDFLDHLIRPNTIEVARPIGELTWPADLYIPRQANWRDHWFVEPPEQHRYAMAWAHPGSTPVCNASRDTGALNSYVASRTTDRFLKCEVGVGVLHRPSARLSTISFEPQVHCNAVGRVWQLVDGSWGSVEVKASVVLAAWLVNPVGDRFELLRAATRHHVIQRLTTSNQGGQGVTQASRTLRGPSTGTKVLVEAGRRYLLGVIARVTTTVELTDSRGDPIPHPNDGSFKLYSMLTGEVPEMRVSTSAVHIP